MNRSRIKVKTHRDCEYKPCSKNFRKRKTTDKYCSQKCDIADNGFPERKTRTEIPKVSAARKKENPIYLKANIEFLNEPENRTCPVTGKSTTEVHHKKGRKGYADKWARDNGVKLLWDKRFFLAVSREGHRQIEENPDWAKEMGYSLSRLENIDYEQPDAGAKENT